MNPPRQGIVIDWLILSGCRRQILLINEIGCSQALGLWRNAGAPEASIATTLLVGRRHARPFSLGIGFRRDHLKDIKTKGLNRAHGGARTTTGPPLRPPNREKPISWRHGSYNLRCCCFAHIRARTSLATLQNRCPCPGGHPQAGPNPDPGWARHGNERRRHVSNDGCRTRTRR